MNDTIDLRLPWQKAYAEWNKTAPRDADMEAMFRSGFYYGLQAKEDEMIRRVTAFFRG